MSSVSFNAKSTCRVRNPIFRYPPLGAPDLLASISVLGGRERGGGLWEHYPGREEVGGLEGAEGDWGPDLVNKSVEITPLILTYTYIYAVELLSGPRLGVFNSY